MAASSRHTTSPVDPADLFSYPPWDPFDPELTSAKPWYSIGPVADDHDSPFLALIKADKRAADLAAALRDKRRRMLRRMPYIVARQLALKKNKKKNATPQRRLLALEDAPDDLFRVVVSLL